MNYNYKVNYRNEKDGKEQGTGNSSDMCRLIRWDVLDLGASLEKEYHNEHILISVSTKDFDLTITSNIEL